MTPDEHLDLILTFCRTALAACEQRTPGEWTYQQDGCESELHNQYGMMFPQLGNCEAAHADAAFIASASIGYESALRSTIAAIEGFRAFTGGLTPTVERNFAHTQLTAIRAAWPQLLK
jgi:hypothetical protein